MLEIRELSAGYPGNPVLQNISLTLQPGSLTVIAGPNGCGKSTLLKAMAGILPAKGSVKLSGRELLTLPTREQAQTVAYLPQNRAVPEITALRLVLHGRFPYLSYPRRYRREDLAIAKAAMDQMGIGDLAERSLSGLSGGQRQKVYIAMMLAQDTPVVLMDEPNTFLDVAHQLQVMQTAKELAARGKIVVLVLHDLPLALEKADRLVVLASGCIQGQGTPEAVYQSGCLETAFGVAVRRVNTETGWKYYFEPAGQRPV